MNDEKPKSTRGKLPPKKKNTQKMGGKIKSIRVKKDRKRTESSRRWLERQLNDPYVHQAQTDGYRARSVYKLIEMDDKLHFLKPNAIVVDLGAAPGSWTQVAVERIKPGKNKGRVIATDILPIDPVTDSEFLLGDFTDNAVFQTLLDMLGGARADVVLSDMAANTTGQRSVDHIRTLYLVELAWDFARRVLTKNGVFISKVFQGGTEKKLLDDLKKNFTSVKHVKPAASRKESPELYVVCTGFKGLRYAPETHEE
jgi:23S rRNA (uridine2552-2'-O)-methyltransferase